MLLAAETLEVTELIRCARFWASAEAFAQFTEEVYGGIRVDLSTGGGEGDTFVAAGWWRFRSLSMLLVCWFD